MEKIVSIPSGIDIEIKGFKVTVSGKKGKLERNFINPMFAKKIKLEKHGEHIKVASTVDKRRIKAVVGTIAACIRAMIKGVTHGYTYRMKIVYMHFPFTVKIAGNEVTVSNFLGSKAVRKAKIVGSAKVELKGEDIIVTGIDNEEVGHTCSNLERATRILKRDRRVFQDGIFLVGKE